MGRLAEAARDAQEARRGHLHGEKVTDGLSLARNAADPGSTMYEAQTKVTRSHLDKIEARKGITIGWRDLISAPFFQYGGRTPRVERSLR